MCRHLAVTEPRPRTLKLRVNSVATSWRNAQPLMLVSGKRAAIHKTLEEVEIIFSKDGLKP